MAKPEKAQTISAVHPTRGTLFAAVDPSARYCKPLACEMKFAAMLAPYPTAEAARAAAADAGAVLAEGGGR